MLSKEDNRRLAQLERQLQRDDPEFCARMRPDGKVRSRRVPISLLLAAGVIWAAALVLGVLGWWIAAVIAAAWAMVIVIALVIRTRPSRARNTGGPEALPPAW